MCRKALGGGWGEVYAGILPCPCHTRMKSEISFFHKSVPSIPFPETGKEVEFFGVFMCHEEVWKNGGKTSYILNQGTS